MKRSKHKADQPALFDTEPEMVPTDQRTAQQRENDASTVLATLQRCYPESCSSALLREKSLHWAEDLDRLREQGYRLHVERAKAGGCLVFLEEN